MVKDVIKAIETEALKLNNIDKVFIGDVTTLMNTNPAQIYPVIVISQDNYSADIKQQWMNITLNIFYIDRQLTDESNTLDIWETATSELYLLVKKIRSMYTTLDNIQIYPFKHRFLDVTAGCWVKVVISVPINLCNVL